MYIVVSCVRPWTLLKISHRFLTCKKAFVGASAWGESTIVCECLWDVVSVFDTNKTIWNYCFGVNIEASFSSAFRVSVSPCIKWGDIASILLTSPDRSFLSCRLYIQRINFGEESAAKAPCVHRFHVDAWNRWGQCWFQAWGIASRQRRGRNRSLWTRKRMEKHVKGNMIEPCNCWGCTNAFSRVMFGNVPHRSAKPFHKATYTVCT